MRYEFSNLLLWSSQTVFSLNLIFPLSSSSYYYFFRGWGFELRAFSFLPKPAWTMILLFMFSTTAEMAGEHHYAAKLLVQISYNEIFPLGLASKHHLPDLCLQSNLQAWTTGTWPRLSFCSTEGWTQLFVFADRYSVTWASLPLKIFFYYTSFGGNGVELRTLYLIDRCYTIWATFSCNVLTHLLLFSLYFLLMMPL
jgi:hypothetical protein